MTGDESRDLLEYIKKISNYNDKDFNEFTPIFKDKILDSMNILDLIAYVQKKIGRKLTDEEIVMKNFKDVSTIIEVFVDGKK